MNIKKNMLAAALLITPLALMAQPGGGPPAGVGGGVGGAVGGAVGGMGHAAGGVAGGVAGASGHATGNINASAGSFGDPMGMSKAELHRAEVAAKKAAAKAKAEAEAAKGAENANENAAFGQETAAQARTLKDADLETRQAFGGTVSTRAQDQGTGGDDTEEEEGMEAESASTGSAKLSGQGVAAEADTHADFGQSTAAGAKTLKDANVQTRTAFGGEVKAGAKSKPRPQAKSSTTP